MNDNKCNICSSEYELVKTENNDYICPNCFSTSNERLFYETIKEEVNKDTSILHLNAKEALHNKLKDISKNYFSYSVDENNNNIQIDSYNFLKTIDSNSMDLILSLHILDSVENDSELLSEYSRILRKDATLILKENVDLELAYKIEEEYINSEKLRKMFYGNKYAVRCYGQDLLELLDNNDFEVSYDDPKTQKDNIKINSELINDVLFVCKKK